MHILNGHVLSSVYSSGGRDRFRSLLVDLRRECRFIRIQEAVEAIESGVEVGNETLVAFTFDDGYEECFTEIAPELSRHGANAAFFVNPGFIDGSEGYRDRLFDERLPDIARRPPMTWEMLRQLVGGGFVVGAHTYDHLRLVGLSGDQLARQVIGCKAVIESRVGVSCEFFAWTYGKYSDIDAEALRVALETYRHVFSGDRYREPTSVGGRVINRRHFECDWPLAHVRYFLSRSRVSQSSVACRE